MPELPTLIPRGERARLQAAEGRADAHREALKAALASLGTTVAEQMPDQRIRQELDEQPYAVVGGALLVGLCLGILL